MDIFSKPTERRGHKAMGLRQRVVCYACQVAVFLTENCSLVLYFFATEGSIGKCKKSPDLVDFQGFVCYKYIEYVYM